MFALDVLIKKVEEFSTLPTVYTALNDVMVNPRSSIHDAAAIISQDQASAAKVLKAANSSVYGLQVNIDTVTQAIFYIGFEEVKNLISTLSIIEMFGKEKITSSISVIDLWKHSIATGIITRLLGSTLRIKKIEQFFIAGILHDIGKLFFLKFIPDEYCKVLDYAVEKNVTTRTAEKEILGTTHSIVGDMLGQKWKLPRNIINAIAYHNSGIVDGKIDLLVALVHIADITANLLELGNSGEEIIPMPNINIWDYLNLGDKTFTELYPKIIDNFNESVSLLLYN